MAGQSKSNIEIGLNAVIVAVEKETPMALVTRPAGDAGTTDALPFGPFDPVEHRTFEAGLRNWVEEQTALDLGYVEQLYTFGDRGRYAERTDRGHVVSVGYLALARRDETADGLLAKTNAKWRPWYDYFPWEDWRTGRPPLVNEAVRPRLEDWTKQGVSALGKGLASRHDRFVQAFGSDSGGWDEERVLDRYELLYEAGLVAEASRDGRLASAKLSRQLGVTMLHDHRRILATAISRLRSKLKYRPVVFELMASEFTLTELQKTVEAIAGRHIHKQNFRRLVENARLVEPTGRANRSTGGRPAALFRFRRNVLREQPGAGLRFG